MEHVMVGEYETQRIARLTPVDDVLASIEARVAPVAQSSSPPQSAAFWPPMPFLPPMVLAPHARYATASR
jgi:hypothetical protein